MILIFKAAQFRISQLIVTFFILAASSLPHTALASDDMPVSNKSSSISEVIADDYRSYFASDRLKRMGLVFGAGAVMANTNIDMSMRNWYQDNVRSERTDFWSSADGDNGAFRAKLFGEGRYMLPVVLLAASVNYLDTDTAVGNWGANASRAYIVGLPAMWGMQFATGGARPGHNVGSGWRPFNSDGYYHGVSGHAFVGAVPFLTIAYMNPDNRWVKYSAYLASMAAGWSRINDDAHYPSQVLLGWYMAWEAVDSVSDNNKKKKGVTVAPMALRDGYGLSASANW